MNRCYKIYCKLMLRNDNEYAQKKLLRALAPWGNFCDF